MMRMELLLEKLTSLLNEQLALYQTLLITLQQERKAIIDSHLITLSECTKEKENLILKIRVLEEQRINYMYAVAEVLESPVHTLTLRELSNRVGEPYASRLCDCATCLSALMQGIQEINHSNKALVAHSLDLIRGSLTFLNNLISENAVYYQTGKMQHLEKSGMVFSDNA